MGNVNEITLIEVDALLVFNHSRRLPVNGHNQIFQNRRIQCYAGMFGNNIKKFHECIDRQVVIPDFEINGRQKLGGLNTKCRNMVFCKRVVCGGLRLFLVRAVRIPGPGVIEMEAIKIVLNMSVNLGNYLSCHFT